MTGDTLIILGALPWSSLVPTPLRLSRWAELLRARPEAAGWPTPALLAAHAALLHRIPRIVLADPAALGPHDRAQLASLGGDAAAALDADGAGRAPAFDEVASALGQLAILGPPGGPTAARGGRVTVHGRAAFTPPGSPRAFDIEGALVAAPLILGRVASLGPHVVLRAAPSGATADHLIAGGDAVLEADPRGAVRLRRPAGQSAPGRAASGVGRSPRESAPPGRAEAARHDDAIAIAALREPLQALTDRLAFARGTADDTRASLLRGARLILDAAVAGGRVAAYSVEVVEERGQLALDVRVRAPRRVHAVALRLCPLDAPPR